jgi:targeting protein for Xklp2
LTVPKEFTFATQLRARPPTVPSKEELEQQELENIPKFKAKPLDPKVLAGPSSAPSKPRSGKRTLTEPEGFRLRTEERLGVKVKEAKQDNVEKKEEKRKKKKRKLEGPFQLQTEVRGHLAEEALQRKLKEERKQEKRMRRFKARPMFAGSPFRPERSNRPLVEIESFGLKTEERGKQKEAALKAKLRKDERQKRKNRQFKARDLPIGEPFVPAPADAPLTEPEPFDLETEERGALKVLHLQEKLAHQAKEEEENRQFRAREINGLVPFVPKKSTKVLTTIEDFSLNTQDRATKRSVFEQHIKEQERKAMELKRQQDLAREKEERKQIKKLRKQLVHKPLPLLKVKPMEPLRSDSALTEPASPFLRTKTRQRSARNRDL